VALFQAAAAHAAGFEEGDAAHSSGYAPRIPEPMYFDLVRPLGASRGELEVNVLGRQGFERGQLQWAPEIEYAIRDGLAVELEFPMEGQRLSEYKVALQGTLGQLRESTMIHGWQIIGRRDRDTRRYGADLLYLNGFTFGGRWSLFNMAGLRSDGAAERRHAGLLNSSLFVEYSQRLTLGLETNTEIGYGGWQGRVIPQLHYDLGPRSTVQVGAGMGRVDRARSTEPIGVARIILTL
jgi:hypothetical protein